MTFSSLHLGAEGESLAEKYLIQKGYKIIQKNYRTKLGEIDLIAKDGETLCFVEVKTRKDVEQGDPLEAVTPSKQNKISRTALRYLQETDNLESDARFDVLGIYLNDPTQIRFELIVNAFDAHK